jgi:hypothetical protein
VWSCPLCFWKEHWLWSQTIWFKWFCHLPAVWLWGNYLISVSIHILEGIKWGRIYKPRKFVRTLLLAKDRNKLKTRLNKRRDQVGPSKCLTEAKFPSGGPFPLLSNLFLPPHLEFTPFPISALSCCLQSLFNVISPKLCLLLKMHVFIPHTTPHPSP